MIIKNIIQTILLSFCLYSFTTISYADDKVSQNDKIKAVFIYNFSKYIQWPENGSSKHFIIGIYGKNNILSTLQNIAKKKLAKGRKIIIKQFSNINEIGKCNILFFSSQVEESISTTLQQIDPKDILTIGETEHFSYNGGMINFIIVNGKIKFEMNLKALRRAGLDAGAQLLKLAVLVEEKE